MGVAVQETGSLDRLAVIARGAWLSYGLYLQRGVDWPYMRKATSYFHGGAAPHTFWRGNSSFR